MRSGSPSSSTLFMAAWSYLETMRLMLPSMDQEGRHHLGGPFALLAGFAIELSSKAYLAGHGWNDQRLQKLRHDLGAGIREARSAGLRLSLPTETDRVIALMQEPHSKLQMRYIPADVASITLPAPDFAHRIVKQLIDDVWDQTPSVREDMPG